jgi:hypothetical protein
MAYALNEAERTAIFSSNHRFKFVLLVLGFVAPVWSAFASAARSFASHVSRLVTGIVVQITCFLYGVHVVAGAVVQASSSHAPMSVAIVS